MYNVTNKFIYSRVKTRQLCFVVSNISVSQSHTILLILLVIVWNLQGTIEISSPPNSSDMIIIKVLTVLLGLQHCSSSNAGILQFVFLSLLFSRQSVELYCSIAICCLPLCNCRTFLRLLLWLLVLSCLCGATNSFLNLLIKHRQRQSHCNSFVCKSSLRAI